MNREIYRLKDWRKGELPCLRCGKAVMLWWNGGELDHTECCGLWYETEHVRVDLVVSENL